VTMRLTVLGCAGSFPGPEAACSAYLIEVDDFRLLLDFGAGSLSALQRFAGLYSIDAVLLSHLHADHFHLPSLRAVPGEPVLIVPRGAAAFVAASLGPEYARRCVELAPGEETAVRGVTVRAVPAAHPGGRAPWSRARAAALGFVVEGASRTWYAGDIGLFADMADLAPLDLALIPVGGWGPTLHAHEHLNAEQAAEALRLVKATWAVPVHYGTFWPIGMARIRTHMFSEPGRRFAELAERTSPDTRVRVLGQGETLTVGRGA